MNKISKFLKKLTPKERHILLKIMADIQVLEIASYDVKPLKGYKNLYRLRKGDWRIVFTKNEQNQKGWIVNAGYRKDIYQDL